MSENATACRVSSSREFLVVVYGFDPHGRPVPVHKPEKCVASSAGAEGKCRIQLAGWRSRKTGPKHPLRRLCCITHGRSFTAYPVGYVPYARVITLCQVDECAGQDFRDSLVGAAVAWKRHERWVEELIEDETGPVRRTQLRRIGKLGRLLGLDGEKVSSRVLEELGLPLARTLGGVKERVAALGEIQPGFAGWLRLVGTMDLVGALSPVCVLSAEESARVRPARSDWARHRRAPPLA